MGEARAEVTDELIGRVFNDRFKVLSLLARGGMGRVYKAEQTPLGRAVALKVLDPRHAGEDDDPQFQQRFFLEASVASKLHHPNTVTVFDYGRTSDGIYFIAMELVDGRSIAQELRAVKTMESARVIQIALQIARSLREAHRLDVIHRDLKPGNVLLTRHGDEDDFVKVLDFGLVKALDKEGEEELTKAGLFMGSPKYMSPEQIRGEEIDGRSDVYSLGVMMYQMLAGRVPFDRDTAVKVLMAHMQEPVPSLPRSDVPPALEQLTMRCLEKNPNNRPASMDEVIVLLKQAGTAMGQTMAMSGAYPLPDPNAGTPSRASGPRVSVMGAAVTPSQAFQAPTPSAGMLQSGGYALPAGTLPGGVATGSLPPNAVSGAWTVPPAHPTGSGPIPQQVVVAQESGVARWLPRLAVLAALSLLAGFVGLRFIEELRAPRGPRMVERQPAPATAAVTPTPTPTSTAPTAVPPVVEAPPEPQHRVVVRVTSTPSGAEVWVGDKRYGETPADVEWWGKNAAPGREVTFDLRKRGYRPESITRTVRNETLEVHGNLRGLRRKRTVRREEPKELTPVPLPPPAVNRDNADADYRNNPY